MADMTPAQARRAIDNLADEYDPNRLFGVATGQNDPSAIADVDDRQRVVGAGEVLDEDELRRRIYGDDAPPRGVEETPAGAAAVNDAARGGFGVEYPVTMDVEIMGQPGERSVEIVPQDYNGPGVDDLEPALEKNFPSEKASDDPVNEFVSAVAASVGRAFPRDLDEPGFAGRVGSVMIRADGSYTFAPGDDPAAAFEETQQSEPDFSRSEPSSSEFEGRGTTEPTTQRSERNQQTLAEAGTSESLTDFAEGTVEDDPDDVIGPAEEVRRQQRAATTGGERTQPRSEGLGRFAQFAATIRATVSQDPPSTNALGEEIPGTTTVIPFVVSPEGQSPTFDLRSDIESALHQAADVDAMLERHGANETVTIGTAHFIDGGDEFDRIEFNDNWIGDTQFDV